VRALYLDIAEWALADPSWAPWAVPSPVSKNDTVGDRKVRKKVTAEIHQRIRERLPHLPVLVAAIEQHLAAMTTLLHAATGTADGQTFTHDGATYRRIIRPGDARRRHHVVPYLLVENQATAEQTDLLRAEDDAFWAWAIIETLRHTGVRHEELLEITHLALVSYRLPTTGETVPLLQIVPSKTNEERLLLVSPELASVLATIVTRLRSRNGGSIPLVARYDLVERVTGPPLPHLFQRKLSWRDAVFSPATVYRLLQDALARTELRNAANQPLRYTPHDFRRMFATDAVTGGLPVHIVARLLGHTNLNTAQAYLAVFQDDLVRTYRAFLDRRRTRRPSEEYREPTEDEWREFNQHFAARKLELGDCGRPYGSPCKHEHSCIRCSMLRVDPRQRARLVEITRNLSERIAEARMNGWLGEVQGLQVSLDAAQTKLASLDRAQRTDGAGLTQLGIPVIRSPQPGLGVG